MVYIGYGEVSWSTPKEDLAEERTFLCNLRRKLDIKI